MEITDIIEYGPERRKLINLAIRRGIDPNIVSDVTITDNTAERLIELAYFDIKDLDSEHIKNIAYLNDWFWPNLKHDYLMGVDNPNPNDIGITTNDLKRRITKRLGYQPDWDEHKEDAMRNRIFSSYEQYAYAVEAGYRWEIITEDDMNKKDLIKVIFTFQNEKDRETILRIAKQEQDRQDRGLVYSMSLNEYALKGLIDVTIDRKYSLPEKDMILRIYNDTGIDSRLIPEIDKEFYKKLKTRLKTNYALDFNHVFETKFTPEEQKMYREMSNRFRRKYSKVLEQPTL